MSKIKQKLKKLLPSKRKLIQLYAALLFNANIKGYINGQIYKGPLKSICTPGLNCYSCPGASGACPLGSLQNALGNSEKRAPYYILGILLLWGIMLGRFICGWLCPFGLIQELFHKIKTPKLKKSRFTRILSYLKYVILAFFVVILPILYGLRNVPLPAFCKYICPAGTLEGAMGLLSNQINQSKLSMLGPLFTWKFLLMVSFIALSVFIFRFFCRFFCPLGAIYGLFNKISVFGIKLEASKCTSCGLCTARCRMDIRKVGDHECISCGECIDVCPTGAIQWKGGRAMVSTLEPTAAEGTDIDITAIEKEKKRLQKKHRIIKSISALLMIALLGTALVYYNFINKATPPAEVGNQVGDACPSYSIPLFDENGLSGESFDAANNQGNVTVINFWGTWCPGCIKELPYFDKVASDYSGRVTVIAIHTDLVFDTAADYVNEHFKDSKMLFGKDTPSSYTDEYYTMLGGTDTYPMTLIVNSEGVITATIPHELTEEELRELVEDALNS